MQVYGWMEKTADTDINTNADADLLWEKNTIISLKRYGW
jgi:hypothetical protein